MATMKKHNNAELNSFVGCFVEFEPASSSQPELVVLILASVLELL